MTLGEIRRRPTLPGRFQPSTISVLRLNFCVRDGNRWIPQAIVTGNMGLSWFASARCSLRSLRLRLALVSLLALGFSIRFLLASASPHPQNRTGRFAPSPDHGALAHLSHSRFFLTNLAESFVGSLCCSSLVSSASSTPLSNLHSPLSFQDQALDLLVSSSSIRYRTSTDDLSTLSSSRGLTCSRSGNSLLWVGFTLRCLQRLSLPHFASLLCTWQYNSCTRGASIPVLSY